MGIQLPTPSTIGTDREVALKTSKYLYQLVPQLQFAFNEIDREMSDIKGKLDTPNESNASVDFVTETGLSLVDSSNANNGYWEYRKWKSGKVDIFGTIKVIPTTEGKIGTVLYCSKEILLTLPFDVDHLHFAVSPTSDHCFVSNMSTVIGDHKKISFRLYRFSDFSEIVAGLYVTIVASGALK